jgi:hypothetical protein
VRGFVALSAALLIAAVTAPVRAECTAESWKGCAGKPWVDGDVMETPLGSRWWPHPLWGPGDEAGSTNWYTKPEVVQRGWAQVKTGKVYRLGQPYTATMPLFGDRSFALRIPGSPSSGPFGANKMVWHDEFLATEIGQGTTASPAPRSARPTASRSWAPRSCIPSWHAVS